MKFDVHMVVEVEEDSNVLGADRVLAHMEVLDQVRTLMYDLDEIELKEIDVELND